MTCKACNYENRYNEPWLNGHECGKVVVPVNKNTVVTCLSADCPERKSVCCGAQSMERRSKTGYFCVKCYAPFIGGKCTAPERVEKQWCASTVCTHDHICGFNDHPQQCQCFHEGYKTGIEAAKGCVPFKWETTEKSFTWREDNSWNECREQTLKSIEELLK